MEGFHSDDVGDWVAELSCGHNQHVRHDPPFRERPWVVTAEGRETKVGSNIDCPLCDRAELPDGLVLVRRAGPFDEHSLPAGLRREHLVARGTWGVLEVHTGAVGLALPAERPQRILSAGQTQTIPPEVPHSLVLRGPVVLTIDFLARRE
ncbi:MAG TPA: DUF3565 domain-containing protein [Acidimicrobiales bacterium]|nr:DUF3565 domain-containing protein [Acidimicrobiales bacterium]